MSTALQFDNHKMSAEQLIPLSAAMLPDAIQVADAFHVVRLGNAGCPSRPIRTSPLHHQ